MTIQSIILYSLVGLVVSGAWHSSDGFDKISEIQGFKSMLREEHIFITQMKVADLTLLG